MWCAFCGKECDTKEVDFGIGSYEFWGARGVDIQLCEVSSCCEDEILKAQPIVLIDRTNRDLYYVIRSEDFQEMVEHGGDEPDYVDFLIQGEID